MTDGLIIHDITRLGRETIGELQTAADALDQHEKGALENFARNVAQAEVTLKNTYKLAALLARRSGTLEHEAEIWKDMRDYSEIVINALKQLKDAYPQCGTPELYNLALDYRLAADKRLALANESIQCQSLPTPDGLFPQVT